MRRNREQYEWWFALSTMGLIPILGLYIIPGTKLTFGAIVVITLITILFLASRLRFRVDTAYMPLFLYIVAQSFFSYWIYGLGLSFVLAVCQYCCYFIILIFLAPKFFNLEKMKTVLLSVADITTLYIIFQQILASFLHIYLGAGLPFLPMIQEGRLWTYAQTVGQRGLAYYRPRSFFSEPATYATFTLLALAVNYFYGNRQLLDESRKRNMRMALYIGGIVVSRSSLGFLTLAVFLLSLVVYRFITGKGKVTRKWLLFLAFFMVIAGLVACTRFIQFHLQRLFLEKNILDDGRFNLLGQLYLLDLSSWYTILLGHDFHLESLQGTVFMPSFFRQLFAFGVLGEIFLIALLYCLYRRVTLGQKIILLLFFVQMLGSELLHGGNFLYYFVWLGAIPSHQAGYSLALSEFRNERLYAVT